MQAKPKIKIPFIVVPIAGALALLGLCIAVLSPLINSIFVRPTPQPTIDLVALQLTAIAQVWLSTTQTALAIPTDIIVPTETPLPTFTAIPTSTPLPLPTVTATATLFLSILPANQPTLDIPQRSNPVACCKHCSNSQPCGDSCISKEKTCHQPPGCACP